MVRTEDIHRVKNCMAQRLLFHSSEVVFHYQLRLSTFSKMAYLYKINTNRFFIQLKDITVRRNRNDVKCVDKIIWLWIHLFDIFIFLLQSSIILSFICKTGQCEPNFLVEIKVFKG